jgi:asparagine synthase (glutamine-hydrolysing)
MIGAMPNWSRVYGILRNVWDSPQMRGLLYGERMLDAAPPDSFAWLEREFPVAGDPVESMQRFEFRHKMVNDLLWHEDRVSMRVGLEVRVPFLDWELVRFTAGQSRRVLMPFGAGKSTLKEYARGILPLAILKRKKSGFQLNIREVFGTVLKPVIDEYLSDERLRRHRLFNPRFVQDVRRNRDQSGQRWHYFLLYLMAQTHMLLEEFDVA